MADPLVSCLCPTYKRPQFVERAVVWWEQQTWQNKELIIVDDSPAELQCRVKEKENIKVVRLKEKWTIGDKHNLLNELAQGDVACYWDDDDWFAPHRIVQQIGPILEGSVDITGVPLQYIVEIPSCRWWKLTPNGRPEKEWVGNGTGHDYNLRFHDGTAMFTRECAKIGILHPSSNIGQKLDFLDGLGRYGFRRTTLSNERTFIYVRHEMNTWKYPYQVAMTRQSAPTWVDKSVVQFWKGKLA